MCRCFTKLFSSQSNAYRFLEKKQNMYLRYFNSRCVVNIIDIYSVSEYTSQLKNRNKVFWFSFYVLYSLISSKVTKFSDEMKPLEFFQKEMFCLRRVFFFFISTHLWINFGLTIVRSFCNGIIVHPSES